MPDIMDLAVMFVIAAIAALVVAWVIGKYEPLADFLNLGKGLL